MSQLVNGRSKNMHASSLVIFPPPLASSTTRYRPPAWGKAIPFSCPLSTVVQGIFSHIFFYIFTFTNLLWTLWTLWTYRDLLVKRLQRLKSDNKSVHSTVHSSSQL